jgi:anthranilate/para-aminobenzoate synthase component I
MTGAPKARAVELLAELEPRPRGVYSGTLVYIDERGTMDASIVIRSVTFSGDRATFGVGGGIVLDSVPEDEWRETLAKARALVEAAGAALGAEMRWELDGS